MTKRTIIFRADCSPSIGMGHFTRTLALAEMLNEHFNCIFATREPTEYQIAEIEKICHSRIDLIEDDSHFEHFLTYLKGDEIVVLDNYYYTTEYQKAIKAIGCKLVCIDDLHDKHFVADVVINHAEGIDSSVYSKESYTKLLLGFKYALIRKQFYYQYKTYESKEFSCLIIIGGTDPYGITNHLLQLMTGMKLPKPIAVVSQIKSNSKNVVWHKNLSATEVSQLMEKAEFGIFPASTVAIETCAKRLPFICGYFTDNQTDIYKGVKEKELAICIGNFEQLDKQSLNDAINLLADPNIYSFIIDRQKASIDKLSDRRFIKEFTNLCN